jgi:hypothetical protein
MFHDMWNNKFSGTSRRSEAAVASQLLSDLHNDLANQLPAGWGIALAREAQRPNGGPDALMTITGPDAAEKRIVVEVKRQVEPRSVSALIEQLRRYALPNEAALVVAPFLSPRTRDLLAEAGISYADATGNLRIQIDRPAVFIRQTGATQNPWREKRSLHSLKGPAAGRVVRALCDFRPPYGIRELAARAQTPASSASRVVALIENEALLSRDVQGRILDVAWSRLIERWTEDYSLVGSNMIQTYLEPRGLDALLQKLRTAPWPYAVTGSFAAIRFAPVAPPRLAVVYVANAAVAAADLKLKRVDRGINVLLAEPFDPVVYERTTSHDTIVYASPSQVAADLLTSSDRAPAEGEALLRWMEGNEDAWRR